jgi:hypothetical protein
VKTIQKILIYDAAVIVIVAIVAFVGGKHVGLKSGRADSTASTEFRYQMHVDAVGRVYRLDKVTGQIRVNYRDTAGVLPDATAWPGELTATDPKP